MGSLSLTWPRVRGAWHTVRQHPWASAFWSIVLLVPVFALYFLCRWLIARIDDVPLIGWLLNRHLLSIFLFSLHAMVLFSNVIQALATFFTMGEMELAMVAPVPYRRIFAARFAEVLTQSSWMVFFILVPYLWAFGSVYHAPFYFYPASLVIVVPFFLMSTAVGVVVTLLLARAFPVRQTRGLLRFFMVFSVGMLVLIFRMLRPEQLVKPDKFQSFAHYLTNLWNPQIDATPAGWTARALMAAGGHAVDDPLSSHAASWGTALAAVLIAWALAHLLHRRLWLDYAEGAGSGLSDLPLREIFERLDRPPGLSAADLVAQVDALVCQPSDRLRAGVEECLDFLPPARRRAVVARVMADVHRQSRDQVESLLAWIPRGPRALLVKDIKVFVRSPVLWTQMMLMGVIVAIYVYNIYLLPTQTLKVLSPQLPDVLVFLNTGFVAFILVAAALRFGYPAISMEGPVFGIIRASPLSVASYVSLRFWSGFVPLIVMGAFLAGSATLLIEPRGAIAVLSMVDVIVLTVTIAALSVAFGARYRDFRCTNPAEIPASFGGMAYMIASLLLGTFVLGIQAYPVWLYLTGWLNLPAYRIRGSILALMDLPASVSAPFAVHMTVATMMVAGSLLLCAWTTRRSLSYARTVLAEGEV